MKGLFLTLMLILSPSILAETLMIQVTVKNGVHQVKRMWKVEQNYPTMRQSITTSDDLMVEIIDASGKVILQDRIENPLVLRGVLNSPDVGTGKGHETTNIDDGSYILRYRYSAEMKSVKIFPVTAPVILRSIPSIPVQPLLNSPIGFN